MWIFVARRSPAPPSGGHQRASTVSRMDGGNGATIAARASSAAQRASSGRPSSADPKGAPPRSPPATSRRARRHRFRRSPASAMTARPARSSRSSRSHAGLWALGTGKHSRKTRVRRLAADFQVERPPQLPRSRRARARESRLCCEQSDHIDRRKSPVDAVSMPLPQPSGTLVERVSGRIVRPR